MSSSQMRIEADDDRQGRMIRRLGPKLDRPDNFKTLRIAETDTILAYWQLYYN